MDEWDRKPKDPPSIWLKLKAKGEIVTIRIAAPPMREVTIWPEERGGQMLDPNMVANFTPGQWMSIMRNPEWNVNEVYVLLVIDRFDGNAKIFRVSGALYGKIREFAKNPKWGNPMGYDLDITRTEAPGKGYWDVIPDPNKNDLLTSEVDKIKALDLPKLLPNAQPANVSQPDDIDEKTKPEPLPWEQSTRSARTAVVTQDEIVDVDDDKPISLDDIPF